MSRKKLKILVDVRSAARINKAGIGHYTARLVEALSHQAPEIEIIGHYYNFLGRQKTSRLPSTPTISYKVSRLIPEKMVNLLRRARIEIPFELLTRSRGDVLFFPDFLTYPSLFKTPTICVIHDLTFINAPETVSARNRQNLERFVPKSLKRADHIVTVSEFSKRQIMNHYRVDPAKISVITPAVDHANYYSKTRQEIEQACQKYKLPSEYILYTGTLEPRKNITGIIEAYDNLDKKLKEKYTLVLAGGRGWNDEAIWDSISKLQKAGARIIYTGYIEDKDLPPIISGASLFVFPSFYEGFGISPLEAMACGVPVVTADNTSLPEAVGDAAVMVKAEDTPAITQALANILTDPGLAAELRNKGFKQAKKFSWEKSAEKLKALLESL